MHVHVVSIHVQYDYAIITMSKIGHDTIETGDYNVGATIGLHNSTRDNNGTYGCNNKYYRIDFTHCQKVKQ